MDCVFGLHHVAHAHNAEVGVDSLAGHDARTMETGGERDACRRSRPTLPPPWAAAFPSSSPRWAGWRRRSWSSPARAPGGFGFSPSPRCAAEELERAIDVLKARDRRPFGVNFLMEQPDAAQIVDAIVRHGVRAAGYSRSPDAELIARLKEGGVLCMPTVGRSRTPRRRSSSARTCVIVQGGEGGGHTGAVPTSLLVPQVVDAVDVPVVAAGGFRDGRGLVAALAYGAAGIAMGTRFLLTVESPVPEASSSVPRGRRRRSSSRARSTVCRSA